MRCWRRALRWAAQAALWAALAAGHPWASAQSNWLRVGQTPFAGGLGQALASDGRDLYVLRQFFDQTPTRFQRLVVQDGLIVQTDNLAPPPHEARAGTALAADPDGNLYALLGGGYGDRRRHALQFTAGRWRELPPTPLDQGPGNAMAFVSHRGQRYLYAVLGAASAQRPAATAFVRLRLGAIAWERLPDPPWACGDDGAALAWDGGEFLYALQGADCQDQPSPAFARFYLTLGLWERLPPAPQPVDDGGSLAWAGGQRLYAIAGAEEDALGLGFFAYDLEAQAWADGVPPLNCPVGSYNGNRLATIDGRLFYWQGAPPTWQGGPGCDGRGVYLFASR